MSLPYHHHRQQHNTYHRNGRSFRFLSTVWLMFLSIFLLVIIPFSLRYHETIPSHQEQEQDKEDDDDYMLPHPVESPSISIASLSRILFPTTGGQRERLHHHEQLKYLTEPCTVFLEEIEFDNLTSTKRWTCELQGKDVVNIGQEFVTLENDYCSYHHLHEDTDTDTDEDSSATSDNIISSTTTEEHHGDDGHISWDDVLKSGKTTIEATDCIRFIKNETSMSFANCNHIHFGKLPSKSPLAVVASNNDIDFNENQPGQEEEASGLHDRNRRTLTGEVPSPPTIKTVLVVRVKANDKSTTYNLSKLKKKVFGTGGDNVNVVERYDACSNHQFQLEPYRGTTVSGVEINDGAIEVSINSKVTKMENGVVRQKVVSALENLVGKNLPNQFDHVMLCLPPGTNGNWIAYAYVNHWLSVYNDKWCSYPSAQTHEIGHNLGLGHSGEGNNEYGDETGIMGYSYSQDEGPKKCFNPSKSWQLGWYTDRRIRVDPFVDGRLDYKLIGVNNYGPLTETTSAAATTAEDDKTYVTVRVDTGDSQDDLFIGFNRRAGINSGTIEAADQVTVQAANGDGFGPSLLKAKLKSGGRYRVSNYKGSGKRLSISVTKINKVSGIADLSIFVEGQECNVDADCTYAPSSCYGTMCKEGYCIIDSSTCPVGTFDIDLTTDKYPEETSWKVIDTCTDTVVASGGPYESKSKTYQDSAAIVHSKLELVVSDSYEDGMCCENGRGSFTAYYDGIQIASGGKFTTSFSKVFGASSCDAVEAIYQPTQYPSSMPSASPSTNAPTGPTASPTTGIPSVVPSAVPTPIEWRLLVREKFDKGFGFFNNGGSNSKIIFDKKESHKGKGVLRLRDNTRTSRSYSDPIDVSAYKQIRVEFYYRATGMEDGKDFFLEYTTNTDGSSGPWNVIEQFISGTNFSNNRWKKHTSYLDVSSLLDDIRIQFRGGGNKKNDMIFIDSVRIEAA